jgi:hypothetical protein
MSDLQDLELIINSGTPLLFIESDDEKQVETLFERVAARLGRALLHWSVATGLKDLQANRLVRHATQEPAKALAEIAARATPSIYLFMDIHHWLEDPLILRLLKEVALGDWPQTLALVSHTAEIPNELRPLAAQFTLSLPDRAALKQLLHAEIQAWGRQHQGRVKAHREVVDALLRNLAGLTANDAKKLIRNALYASHANKESLSTAHILAEIQRSKPLSMLMAEKIAYLRSWAAERTVSA